MGGSTGTFRGPTPRSSWPAGIAGIPPLSVLHKDEILWRAFTTQILLWLLGRRSVPDGLLMTRLYILVFRGRERFDEETRTTHESPRSMPFRWRSCLLAAVGGWVGFPEAITKAPS